MTLLTRRTVPIFPLIQRWALKFEITLFEVKKFEVTLFEITHFEATKFEILRQSF